MASIDEILGKLERLPAIPIAVTQLISNLCDASDDPSKEATAQIVMRDSALTTSVLRAANSAALGFQMPASTVDEALSRVGENALLKIALGHASEAALGGSNEEYGLEEGEAWLGALAGAFAAEAIAKRSQLCDPNLAFTAGLLRDIGKLAMGLVVPRQDLVEVLLAGHPDMITREMNTFGFDHAQVGEALGRSWGMPETLLLAIRYHHEPPAGNDADALYDTVHCADSVAMMLGYGVGLDGLAYKLSAASCELLKLDRPAMEDVLVAVRLRMSDFLAENAENSTQA